MTDLQAKENGYTNHAMMYGINGYAKFDDEGIEFRSKYWLMDQIYEAILYIDMLIGFNEYGFKVKIYDKL